MRHTAITSRVHLEEPRRVERDLGGGRVAVGRRPPLDEVRDVELVRPEAGQVEHLPHPNRRRGAAGRGGGRRRRPPRRRRRCDGREAPRPLLVVVKRRGSYH